MANYEKAYEKVEDEEALSYIKLINLNTKVRSRGVLDSKIDVMSVAKILLCVQNV